MEALAHALLAVALAVFQGGSAAPGAPGTTDSGDAGPAGRTPGAETFQERASSDESPLLVLAAASLTEVLPRVADRWTREGGGTVAFSFDATSRLAGQAARGVPADLFLSADLEWIDWLAQRGGIEADTRTVLLRNDLVVVVPADAPLVPAGPGDLDAPSIRRIGLAGESVPAGRYARDALVAAGLWSRVEGRVVQGSSVRGALEWVVLGEVDAAVVYATDARAEPRVRVAFDLPAGPSGGPVYGAAVLTGAPRAAAARDFLAFLASGPARSIFRDAGFRPVAEDGERVPQLRSPGPDPHVPDTWSAVRLSLLVGGAVALMGLVPSVALGWLLARRDFAGKSLATTVVLVPLVLPPVVTGFLLLTAFGREGVLGGWLEATGLPVSFTLLGAVLAALVVGLPLYVVAARAAFESVDPAYEEVSLTLGVPPARTFFRITIPLALPGIAAGAVLAFARALGEFGATVVLAGNLEGRTRTIALAVYTLLESPSGGERIWVLVACSVGLSAAALMGYELLSRRQRARLEDR